MIIIEECLNFSQCLSTRLIITVNANFQVYNNKDGAFFLHLVQVAQMVIVIAVAFILAWSPHYLVSIASVLQKSFHKSNFFDKENYVFTMLMTHFFGFTNSCMNPLIYNAMSTAFKKRFRATLRRIFCRPFTKFKRQG